VQGCVRKFAALLHASRAASREEEFFVLDCAEVPEGNRRSFADIQNKKECGRT